VLTLSHSILPRFESELEREFQESYYKWIRPMLRVVALLVGFMFLLYAFRDYSDTRSLALALRQDGAPAFFFLLFCALTWVRGFGRIWQPVAVAGGCIMATISLPKMGSFIASLHLAPTSAATVFPGDSLFFG
jgi:hypothetical protein